MIIVIACTTGRSRSPTACTSSCPMPGNPKTVSVTTTPPMEPANCSASALTTGGAALGSTCRNVSRPPGTPRRIAALMYGSELTSLALALVSLVTYGMIVSAIVTAGSTYELRSPQGDSENPAVVELTGSRRSLTATTNTTSSPITNSGSAATASTTAELAASARPPARRPVQ